MADGTSFEIGIKADGSQAVSAATAVDSLAASLESASAASRAAADAVKAASASYAAAEATAGKAGKALEQVGNAIADTQAKIAKASAAGDTKAVSALEAKLGQLVTRQTEAAIASAKANAALQAEATALDKASVAAGKAADAETKLGKELAAAKLSEGSGKASEAASAFGHLPGPLGAVAQKAFQLRDGWEKLSSSLGDAAGPAVALVGLAAIAAAVVAVGAALGAAALKLAAFAISSADAARTSDLLNAGIARSTKGGEILGAKIESLAARVPIAENELQSMASTLASSGLRGEALAAALETAAVKAAKLKFGPEFAREMLSLDRQSQRLKANVAGVFGGLKIEGLLEGLATMVALLDKGTASGNFIRLVFEGLFQPAIDGVAGFATKAERVFLQLEIWAVQGLTALRPYESKFERLGALVGELAAQMEGPAVASLAIVGAAIGVVVVNALTFAAAVGGALQKFDELKAGALDFAASLRAMSLEDIGHAMLAGLARGITAGGAAAVGALTGVVNSAVNAAKAALGIHSPSAVFAEEVGGPIMAGIQQPIDDGAGDLQGAIVSATAPPEQAGGGATAGNTTNNSGGNTFVFNISGGNIEDVKRALLDVLEGDVAQAGAAHA